MQIAFFIVKFCILDIDCLICILYYRIYICENAKPNNIKCNLCENAKFNNIKCNLTITKIQSTELHVHLDKYVLHFFVYNIALYVPRGGM